MTNDLSNRRFGRLSVVRRDGHDGNGSLVWLCKCDCGTETRVASRNLTVPRGTQSCGCFQRDRMREAHTTHGGAPKAGHASEYTVWRSMKARCERPTGTGYKYYGGRGISVCKEWSESYAAFFRDMGPRPSRAYSIDRIDNNGNYEPGNCRWATQAQQVRNRRTSRKVHRGDGETFETVVDAAASVGADPSTISEACRRGRVSFGHTWRYDRALISQKEGVE